MDGAMRAGYPAYESYKDSGEGWIEEIPAHWETRKLKQLFQEKRHRPNLALSCGAISFGEVVEKDDERVPLATKASYQEVLAGEFLVNPLNLNYDLKSLRIGLSDVDVVVSAGYIVLQAKDDMDKRYFKYLLHRYDVANMKLLGSGVRQTISFNHIANSILVAPPLSEQRAIAGFLDEKCAGVDEAVRIKQAQIALLRERRQILIQEAVTRGLNPSAPMKDSGIDWIGQIPAHWEVKRFTKEVYVQEGPGIMAVDFREGGVPLIRISGVRTKTVTLEGCNYLDPAKVRRKWNHFLLEEGDLVISGSASTGLVAEVGNEAAGAVLYTGLMKLRIKNAESLLKPYFEHFLGSQAFDIQVDLLKAGSTIAHYGPSHLNKMFILVPPPREQEEVAAYCDHENKRFDSAIAIKEEQIAALREYRTSLINAAVTGKIRVA